MSESKTPRSDAEESKARALYEQQREVNWPPFDSSPYDFARTLELELNEALKQTNNQSERINELIKICEEWRTDYTKQSAQMAAAQAELNEANENYKKLEDFYNTLLDECIDNADGAPDAVGVGRFAMHLVALSNRLFLGGAITLRSQLATAQQEIAALKEQLK